MRGLLLPLSVALILAVPLLWRLPDDLEPAPPAEAFMAPAAGLQTETAQMAARPESGPEDPATQP